MNLYFKLSGLDLLEAEQLWTGDSLADFVQCILCVLLTNKIWGSSFCHKLVMRAQYLKGS